MKKCTGCKEIRELKFFSKNKNTKDGHTHYCKMCVAVQNQEWTSKNKERAVKNTEKFRKGRVAEVRKLKETLSCAVCGEKETVCLDFHHKDPKQKDLNVSLMVRRGLAWDRVLEEISKCVCVCSNCHRKIHANVIQLEG